MKIIYQDKYLQIINKKAGIISTDISPLICHRLDRDTSGILVIAKNKGVKKAVQRLFKEHKIKKRYLALVSGVIRNKGGRLEGYIVRHKKMSHKRRFIRALNFAIALKHKRLAISEYKVKKIYQKEMFKNPSQKNLNFMTLVEIKILTGRTHQIRAQFSELHHPIIGDLLYGGKLMKQINKILIIERQFLHAYKLQFRHPITNKIIKVNSKLPSELKEVINKLETIRN